MDETLELVYSLVWKFALLMLLIGTGVHFAYDTNIREVTKAYAEMTAVTGGFTSSQLTQLKTDLSQLGYDPTKIVITITATSSGGADLTSKVTNVTPLDQSPYPATPIFCPRGSKITLVVSSTDKSALNGIYTFFKINSTLKKGYAKIVYMSERVE